MTFTDAGVRGATGQSWRGANPRDLLKRVIDDNPGSDRVALFKLFVEQLKDDDGDYMETIIEYWFANNYHSLIAARASSAAADVGLAESGRRSSSSATAAERAAWVAGTTERLREKIAEEATIALLDMTMPNGKHLAECTGEECGFLGRRLGNWLRKVARRLKPHETVGDVLTEADLRALYDRKSA